MKHRTGKARPNEVLAIGNDAYRPPFKMITDDGSAIDRTDECTAGQDEKPSGRDSGTGGVWLPGFPDEDHSR